MIKVSVRKKYEGIINRKKVKLNVLEPSLSSRLGSLIKREIGCRRDQKQSKRMSVPLSGRTFIP